MSNGDDDQTPAPKALPVDPGVTVKRATPAPQPAPAAPITPASNWDQILENTDPRYTGKPGWTTTVFATPKDLRTGEDNGVGHPALGGVDTAHSYGVAIPDDVLTKFYGGKKTDDPSTLAKWRTARAQITVNGKTYVVPISDIGPGKGPQAPPPKGGNRSTDLTSDLAKGIPGWMDDMSDGPVQVKLLPPGSGPDYLTDRPAWDAEQQNIGKQLTPTPLGSPDIVNPVQSFAKGGLVQPIEPDDTDSDDTHGYTGRHLGGHFGAVNA